MSYAISSALQGAVYQHLLADTSLAALVGGHIYDAVPAGAVPATYVSLGPETVLDRSDKTGAGALHKLTVSVVTDMAGFAGAKDVAVAINDALQDADLTLARGRLVYLHFDKARAQRSDDGSARRIDLTFDARVEDI